MTSRRKIYPGASGLERSGGSAIVPTENLAESNPVSEGWILELTRFDLRSAMKRIAFLALLVPALLSLAATDAAANDWPTWRGPNGDGRLPDDAVYPVEWSADRNLLWRAELPAPGNSSAIVSGDRVFVIVAEDDGHLRSLLCFDAGDGRQLWKRSVEFGSDELTHKTNPHSAASPVTDGKLVYAWHGNAGLWAYDFEGREQWHRDLGTDYAHIWGPNAASPVFLGSTMIIHAGPGLAVRLLALDRATGKTLWETELPDAVSDDVKQFKGSWATPTLIENGGRTEMLIGLPGFLKSFDPKTGKELWRIGGLSDLAYSNVLTGNGRAVYLCGFGGPGIGVRLPGPTETGDHTETHRLWADPPKGQNQNPQRIGSGQIVGDHLYLLNEPGVAQCLEVETGESVWRERLGRRSWSSMNLVGGKLYVNDSSATTFVIDPSPEGLKLLATNPLGENLATNATPAFAGGRIYLRTDSALFAIGDGR